MANSRIFLALIAAALFATGCHRSSPTPAAGARQYEVRGFVRGIAPDRSTIDIEHEDIPGFMPSMTMPFALRDSKAVDNLAIGDSISFRMIVTQNDLLADRFAKISPDEIHVGIHKPRPKSTPATAARLHEGDKMPLFSLLDQNGKTLTLDRFRGQPFVLTFVFTRCPVPNFCPRMTNNFSEVQNLIKTSEGAVAKTRLLSITLDPAFDTPHVLKQYGAHSQEDPGIWTLATGEPKEIDALTEAFSVYRQTEGGTLSHGLATALVSPDGKVVKIWRGNAWTPEEIVSEIRTRNF